MNKRELKEMIDQQHESINKLVADNLKLIDKVATLETDAKQYLAWYKDETAKVLFYKHKLRRLRYIMAMDTVEAGTHRSRNELYRNLVNEIAYWLSLNVTHETNTDMDDIPF